MSSGGFLKILAILWILGIVACDNGDINTCSFYYWRVDWRTAVETCLAEDKQLLCYKSKKEIDDITDAFRLAAFGTARLELWLSSRDCLYNEMEECLSLHIQKSGENVWHYFQRDCEEDSFPFVCCINGSVEVTSSTKVHTSTTQNMTTDYFSISDSSLQTTTLESSTFSVPFCKKVINRGIKWPDTEAGAIAVMECPGNSTGQAYWACENFAHPRWKDGGPNMTNCRLMEIKNLKERFDSISATDAISEIRSIFNNSEIFAHDLSDVLSLMATLPDRLFQEVQSMPTSAKWTSTKDHVDKAISVIDRMVELDSTWQDINMKHRSQVGTKLLSTVDGMGILLADSMPDEEKVQSIIGKNMVMQIMKPKSGESTILPQLVVTGHYSHRGQITLEEGYDDKLTRDQGNVSVVFTLYADMSKILLPPVSKSDKNHTSSLNSAVVSATVTQGRKSAKIDSEVRITMEHLTSRPNKSACVFWNVDRDIWDITGCRMVDNNGSYSVCVCNHLTNFALLMDYNDVLSDVDQLPFHYITLVGCYLSIVCLAICVGVFSLYSYHTRHSWGLRYTIHRNLCTCLLVANVVLVAGLDSTNNERICAIVAGLLHYFFLAAFSWMFLEAIHIYLLLVVVFASRRSHIEKYYGFGYGFPLIVVIITAIVRPTYYGTDQICWLSPDKGTIWAFMGPVACILTMNTAALILAQYKASKVSAKDDNVALIKRWLRVTLILFPVLGITWLFGFLYLGRHFEVVGYLFAIFNSLQGVCIFVFHCLMDKKARSMVVDSIRKKTITTTTGSSGTPNRKSKEQTPENVRKKNTITPVECDGMNNLNKPHKTIPLTDGTKKDWSKWRNPWSFCFEMPVSDKKKNTIKKQQEEIPVAVAVNWNSTEKNCS